MVEYLLNQQDR